MTIFIEIKIIILFHFGYIHIQNEIAKKQYKMLKKKQIACIQNKTFVT